MNLVSLRATLDNVSAALDVALQSQEKAALDVSLQNQEKQLGGGGGGSKNASTGATATSHQCQ
jgi:hypothetical protein